MKIDYLIKFKKKIKQNLQQVWRAVLKSLQARPKTYLLVLSSLVLIMVLIPILNSIKKSQTSQAAGLQIQSVFPRIGTPAGGDKVRIRGKNFKENKPLALKQVALGEMHACALGSNGKAYCWGVDYDGSLGNNLSDDDDPFLTTPVAVHQGEIPTGITIIQITAGWATTCALGSNGKAYCWGRGNYGQLGNDTTTNAKTPVAVHQGQIPAGVSLTQIATGGSHTCALGSDAKAYCWGYGQFGQLGNNAITDAHTPVAVHQGQIPAGVSLTQIATGGSHTCALGSDAKAYCWGNSSYGKLGNNSTTNALTPVTIHQGEIPTGITIIQITAGRDTTCALGSDAKGYCWGRGASGQLGNNSTTDSSIPVAVHQGEIPSGVGSTKIITNFDYACVLNSNGKAYCWGNNGGQLGNGTFANAHTPVAVHQGEIPLEGTQVKVDNTPVPVKYISPYELEITMPAHSAGKVDITVTNPDNTTHTLNQAYEYYTQPGLVIWSIAPRSGPVAGNTRLTASGANLDPMRWKGVYSGASHTCALSSESKVYCWGKNDHGQLGTGNTTDSSIPVATKLGEIPPTVTILQLAVKANHACVLTSNGRAYCWGNNEDGQLGNNATTNALTPVAVHQGQIPAGVSLTQITTGSNHTCALGSNTKAYCWGANYNGRLGNNTMTDALTPVAVHQGQIPAGVSLTQITTGSNHTCALGSDAKAYCWGYGNDGQLGNDATTNVPTPIRVHDNVYNIKAGQADETTSPGLKRVMASSNYELSFNVPPASLTNSNKPAPHVGRIGFVFTHAITGNYLSGIEYTYYTIPPAPTDLTTTTTLPLGSITLSFKSPSTAGLDNQANAGNNYSAITDYRIDYCLANSAGTACQDPTNTTPTTTNPTNWLTHTHTPLISTSINPLSLTIPNLTKPGKYLFRVAAINQAGLGTYAQSIATLASYVSLQTNPTLGINLTPLHNQTYSSNKLTLISSSNLTSGHKLTMTSTTTNNQLIHNTISANTINSTTHSFTNPNILTPNTWGFYIPNTTTNQQHNTISYSQFSNQDTTYTNQSNPNLKHAQLPTTPLTIANYNQPLTNQPLNLIFGINISNTQPSGNYQATMKFEVVGN